MQRRLSRKHFDPSLETSKWSWRDVMKRWTDRLQAVGVVMPPRAIDRPLFDPKNPDRQFGVLMYVESGTADERHKYWQRFFYQWPGTNGVEAHVEGSKGKQRTLELLHDARHDPEKVAGLLMFASLRGETFRFDDYPREYLRHLGRLIDANVDHFSRYYYHQQVHLLPGYSNYNEPISSEVKFEVFLDHIIDELIERMSSVEILRFFGASAPDPQLHSEIELAQAKSERAHDEFMERIRVRDEERKLERDRRLVEHPRMDDWNRLSADELRHLVWSNPTTTVAKMFGVSDVAVGKCCKLLNITKPPAGFWARVQSGKIPHPQGAPVY